MDTAEIVVPLTSEEIDQLWLESEPWQRVCSNFREILITNIPEVEELNFYRKLIGSFLVLCIVNQFLEPLHFIQMQTNQERRLQIRTYK